MGVRFSGKTCVRFIILVIVLVAKSVSVSSEDLKIVESEGTSVLGDDTTPAQAKAIALNNARRNALENAVGVSLRGSSVIYNSELISDLVVTATKGIIVGEKILESNCRTEEDKIYCIAKIEAQVKPLKVEKRGDFRIIRASVVRPDKGVSMKSPVFQNNDEIQVRVAVNTDSYINIFSVDQFGNILKLLPNEYFQQDLVPSRKTFVFPDDVQRSMGLKLRVATPPKLKKAVESVLIIATRKRVELLSDSIVQNPTLSDLMKELSELETSMWVEKTVGYEVRK